MDNLALQSYLPLLFIFALGVVFSGAFLVLSFIFGPKKPTPEKLDFYECGITVHHGAHSRFSVKFFLVALIFLLFDVEIVFLFPWAALFKEFKDLGMGLAALGSMGLFFVILSLGLVYQWKRGGLDWEK